MTDELIPGHPSFVESLIGRLIYNLAGSPMAGSVMLEDPDALEPPAFRLSDLALGKGLLGLALMSGIKPIASQSIKAYLPKVVTNARKKIVESIASKAASQKTGSLGKDAVTVYISSQKQ